jgi:hypothetical protein
MWDCEKCGTTNIVPDLNHCPHCGEPRPGVRQAAEPSKSGVPADAEKSVVPPADSAKAPPPSRKTGGR